MIILKIILFIILAILGIILLLMFFPIRIKFSFIDQKVVYNVKYAFVKIIDSERGKVNSSSVKSKSGKNKTADKSEELLNKEDKTSEKSDNEKKMTDADEKKNLNVQDNENLTENTQNPGIKDSESGNENEEKGKPTAKKTFGEKVGFIMDIWNSAKRPVRKILKGFHFNNIYVDFLVADEDAYKCAIKYGRISGFFYNLIACMDRIFTLKYKSIDINCGFAEEKSRWDVGFNVRFLPITAIVSGIWFLITYIFRIYIPERFKKRKLKKSVSEQNTQPQGGL